MKMITKEKGEAIKNDYNLDLFVECSARDGRNTEYIFVQAAKLLYTDYIKYKIGNPLIGKKSGNNSGGGNNNGKMILFMVKVYYIMKTEILYMMDNLFEVNLKVMENIIITMVVGTLGNGKTV